MLANDGIQSVNHDALVEALSGTVDTNDRGVMSYRNVQGRRHRTDGPAMIQEDGDVYWFLNDIRLSEEEFNQRIASGEYRDP